MTVKDLKALLDQYPDDSLVVIDDRPLSLRVKDADGLFHEVANYTDTQRDLYAWWGGHTPGGVLSE